MVQNKLLGRIQLVKVIYQNDLGRKFSFHPKVPFVIKPAKLLMNYYFLSLSIYPIAPMNNL